MAKKTKKAPARQEVERIDLGNGTVIVKYDDGTVEVITTTALTAEQAQQVFGNEDDSDEEDEDDDDSDEEDEDDDDSDEEDEDDSDEEDEDEDDDEVTPEMLAEADFEELEDICDEKELDTDPDDFDEEDVEKLRKAIAKEMGIKLPAKGKKGKK